MFRLFARDATNTDDPQTMQCGTRNPPCLFPEEDGGDGDNDGESSVIGLTCEDTLESWCQAHGLGVHQRKTLLAIGTTTYLDFFEMSPQDKAALIGGLNLELVQKNRILLALDPESLALFHECTDRRLSVDEYRKQCTALRLRKVSCNGTTNHQSSSADPTAPLLDAKSSALSSLSNDGGGRSLDARCVHSAPHKVVVHDREKAVSDNPSLEAGDFMSFKTDTINLPPGGTVKVILVVGKTGSGKTSTINSFVNHLYGVNYEDKFRFKLISEPSRTGKRSLLRRPQCTSKTDQLVGYLLESPPALGGSDWVLVVDTPGFGDGRGIAHDEAIVREIKSFFSTEINYVNAVWFVTQSNDARLTIAQRWMYEQIISMFGGNKDNDDVASFVFSYCDTEQPPALKDLMGSLRMNRIEYYKVNNSGFILKDGVKTAGCESSRVEGTMNTLFWDMSMASFHSLVESLRSSQAHVLLAEGAGAAHSLSCREYFARSIENAWREAEDKISKLISLEQTIPLIAQAKSKIDKNSFEVETTKYLRVRSLRTEHGPSIVCDACQCTCVDHCAVVGDDESTDLPQGGRITKGIGGYYCKTCPKKCHWSTHRYVDRVWDLKEYKLHKNIQEMKYLYVRESSGRTAYDQIMSGLKKDFQKTQNELYDLVQSVQAATTELQGASLPPDAFLGEYVDMMRDTTREVKDKKKVWKWRMGVLEAGTKYIDCVGSGTVFDLDERIYQLMRQTEENDDKMYSTW